MLLAGRARTGIAGDVLTENSMYGPRPHVLFTLRQDMVAGTCISTCMHNAFVTPPTKYAFSWPCCLRGKKCHNWQYVITKRLVRSTGTADDSPPWLPTVLLFCGGQQQAGPGADPGPPRCQGMTF